MNMTRVGLEPTTSRFVLRSATTALSRVLKFNVERVHKIGTEVPSSLSVQVLYEVISHIGFGVNTSSVFEVWPHILP